MLSETRKGEIAIAILKLRLREEGIRVGPYIKRELPNKAKQLNIDAGELSEFFELMVREMVDETFKK